LMVSILAVGVGGGTLAPANPASATRRPEPWAVRQLQEQAAKHMQWVKSHKASQDDPHESLNSMAAAKQWAEARLAPSVVAPGAYSAAWKQLTSLPRAGGTWQHVTNRPYDSDDPRYRDACSNSSL